MTLVNETAWEIMLGSVKHFRAHWVHAPEGDDATYHGYIQLENFSECIRDYAVKIYDINGERITQYNPIPRNEAYWVVTDWSDVRQFNESGDVIYKKSFSPLVNIRIKMIG